MFESHDSALVVAYASALACAALLQARAPSLWPQPAPEPLAHPWRSLGALLLGIAGVIGVGQAYQHGVRLPESGAWAPIAGALNQLFIFAPAFLVIALRRESPRTLWLGRTRFLARLAAGAALALLALFVYTLVRSGADAFPTVLARVVVPDHFDEAVQVALEDLLIAALFVRCAAALRSPRWTIVLVAVLFAAGHVPALLAKGAGADELLWLVRDAALGVAVVALLARSRDIVWFYGVHLVMDLTQFERVVFGGASS